jgi:hypothetical protein
MLVDNSQSRLCTASCSQRLRFDKLLDLFPGDGCAKLFLELGKILSIAQIILEGLLTSLRHGFCIQGYPTAVFNIVWLVLSLPFSVLPSSFRILRRAFGLLLISRVALILLTMQWLRKIIRVVMRLSPVFDR